MLSTTTASSFPPALPEPGESDVDEQHVPGIESLYAQYALGHGGVFQDRREQPLRASEAILLRPSDVDTIIKWTMVWCMGKGLGSDHASELVDDLANGVKVVILYFADRAGHS